MLSKCAEAAVREHTVSSRVVSAPADLSDFEPAIEMDTKVAILALFDAKGIPEAEQGSGVVTVVGRSVRGLDDLTEDEGQAVIARLSTHYPDGYRLVVLMGEGEVPPPDVMERNRRQAGQDHAR